MVSPCFCVACQLLCAMVMLEGNATAVCSCRVFIPMCFSILVERFADQVITSTVLDSEDGMRAAIMQCFTEFDVEGVFLNFRIPSVSYRPV